MEKIFIVKEDNLDYINSFVEGVWHVVSVTPQIVSGSDNVWVQGKWLVVISNENSSIKI
jgi:hypothetical protein